MAKLRRRREALGFITRDDGVRVEVKNPTIWKLLHQQAATTQAQQQVIESLKGTLAKLEAERDYARKRVDELDRNWWVRLGVWLGLVRLVEFAPTPGAPTPAPPGFGPTAPRKSEAIPAA